MFSLNDDWQSTKQTDKLLHQIFGGRSFLKKKSEIRADDRKELSPHLASSSESRPDTGQERDSDSEHEMLSKKQKKHLKEKRRLERKRKGPETKNLNDDIKQLVSTPCESKKRKLTDEKETEIQASVKNKFRGPNFSTSNTKHYELPKDNSETKKPCKNKFKSMETARKSESSVFPFVVQTKVEKNLPSKKTKLKTKFDSHKNQSETSSTLNSEISLNEHEKISKKRKKKKKRCKNKFKPSEKPAVPITFSETTKEDEDLLPTNTLQKIHKSFTPKNVHNSSSVEDPKPKQHHVKNKETIVSNDTDLLNYNNKHRELKHSKNDLGINRSPYEISKLKLILASNSKKQRIDASSKKDVIQKQETTLPQDRSSALRLKMEERLKSARFRYINEQLYNKSGKEALTLFKVDPEAFHIYHDGFQSQVSKWPENPVDKVIAHIKKRGTSAVVADFGCGDAKVARSVTNKVHSFDLVAQNNLVKVCDMAKVPLKSFSVDIAVFCLSLMGTNMADYLIEASRVLKTGGTLLLAEVASRFEKVYLFIQALEEMGFALKEKESDNKMFLWFEFMKTRSITRQSIPDLGLTPCVYKKR